jgi:hypothetical protein
MSDREESGTPPLDGARRETLAVVLNLIIPPSDDGRLPGAAEYDVLGHIRDRASSLLPVLREELDRLDALARARHGRPFATLGGAEAEAAVQALRAAEPRFLAGLAAQTASCYYQQDRVLEAIGMEARAPFPKGFEVEPGDLSLLDPVRRRGRVYREVE